MSTNFASMKDINKICYPMLDFSKFIFNKKILNNIKANFLTKFVPRKLIITNEYIYIYSLVMNIYKFS